MTDWDDEKCFIHKNGQLITYTETPNSFSKIQSIMCKEIPPYTTAAIKTNFNLATIKEQNTYLLTADFAFIDSNPNLKFYPMLVNNNTSRHAHNLPHIITNNSYHKIFIPEGITTGTSERIN